MSALLGMGLHPGKEWGVHPGEGGLHWEAGESAPKRPVGLHPG